MLIGIGFISMLTGTIATFFIKKMKTTVFNENKVLDLSELDDEKFQSVKDYCDYLKNK